MAKQITQVIALTPNPQDKVDCGQMGSTQQTCEASGCCWKPVEPNPDNYPWCYYTSDVEVHNLSRCFKTNELIFTFVFGYRN
jgi:hypothetical protein